MELYWKAAAGILIAAVLTMALGKDLGLALALAVCSMAAIIALEFLEPVLDLLRRLESMAGLQSGAIGILLKAMGIALVSELAAMICSDSGNASLGKAVHLLGSCTILWVATPLFQSVLNILQQILGEL